MHERFWSKVDVRGEDDCWEWIAARNCAGYGVFNIDGFNLAHRYSFHTERGPIGGIICHTCNNPPCVNPAHLYYGTHQDNMLDWLKISKRRGERHPMAKLTPVDVSEIRAMGGTMMQREIARKYGVSASCISSILRRKTWGHL
jgi:hypothetical protein